MGRIGPYSIDREIGRGGMGVVYLAHDERLGRRVALKALPDAVAHDGDRAARFEREARLLAGLSHEGIASVYGVEVAEGRSWLAMEHVEGEALAERLSRGPLPVDEALEVCAQIASAVEHAHEMGVVHRDLKPGNVILTADGRVKVLDFGLAKAVEGRSGSGVAENSPTLSMAATAQGVILGTAAYMSPEQARGRAVDRRTDVWSFGCVLFECLVGARVFGGETTSDAIAAVLERSPEWSRLPAGTPLRVRELLERCLERDPKKRLRDIGDARLEIERALERREWTSAGRAAAGGGSARRTGWVVALAAVVGLAAGWGAFGLLAKEDGVERGGVEGVTRLSIPLPEGMSAVQISISSDGRTALFRLRDTKRAAYGDAPTSVYLKRMGEEGLRRLEGTGDARLAELSPDGRWVGVVTPAEDGTGLRRVLRMPTDGSSPALEIGHIDSTDSLAGIEFLPGGDLAVLVGRKPRIRRFGLAGDLAGSVIDLKNVEDAEGVRALYPFGDGRRLATDVSRFTNNRYIVSAALIDYETGDVAPLVRDGGSASYVDTGHVIFARGESIMAAPFDLARLETTGPPVMVCGGLRTEAHWEPADYALSESGCLMHLPGGLSDRMRGLSIVERGGGLTAWAEDRWQIDAEMVATTSDARRICVGLINAAGLYELWQAGADRRVFQRAVWSEGADAARPLLSADGRLLAYTLAGTPGKVDGVYVRAVEGGEARLVLKALDWREEFLAATSFLPDGSGVFIERWTPEGNGILFARLTGGEAEAVRTVVWAEEGGHEGAVVSPDGRAVAMCTSLPGSEQAIVFAHDPAKPGDLGDSVLLPLREVESMAWSGRVVDGRQELIIDAAGAMHAALVSVEPGLEVSAPERLLEHGAFSPPILSAAPLADGRFLVVQAAAGEMPPSTISVVLNWKEELKQRLRGQPALP